MKETINIYKAVLKSEVDVATNTVYKLSVLIEAKDYIHGLDIANAKCAELGYKMQSFNWVKSKKQTVKN
jgi:hypothetical protein